MIKPFIYALITCLALDAVWLTINLDSHTKLFESVQKAPIVVRLAPALLVYILIPAALTYFAIQTSKNLKESITKGALLGLSMYGLYDLTNLATLKGWTYEMLLKDTAWGTFLCAAASGIGFYFGK
jgi:uncharacterized membrane protein